jgi:outer membrane protein assembly factor BamA
MEVRPQPTNAEPAIVLRGSGRLTIAKTVQVQQNPSGIAVTCDGVSNVTDDKLVQYLKTNAPRVETEEGTVKETRLEQLENASDSIV